MVSFAVQKCCNKSITKEKDKNNQDFQRTRVKGTLTAGAFTTDNRNITCSTHVHLSFDCQNTMYMYKHMATTLTMHLSQKAFLTTKHKPCTKFLHSGQFCVHVHKSSECYNSDPLTTLIK